MSIFARLNFTAMKKSSFFTTLILLLIGAFSLSSCGKRVEIELSKNLLSFSSAGGVEFIQVTANCMWSISMDENVNWFSVTPTEGENDGLLAITVNNYSESSDREASFTINSSNGKRHKKVTIHQNEIEIKEITDCVWFLEFYERWNIDYYHNFIEDSYEYWSYSPTYDQTHFFLYFLADSTGYQIKTQNGDTVFFPYNYVYYPAGDSLYINFETVNDAPEDYHATIDALNDEVFIFHDEWKTNFFEKLNLMRLAIQEQKSTLYINPNKVQKKQHGPLVDVR